MLPKTNVSPRKNKFTFTAGTKCLVLTSRKSKASEEEFPGTFCLWMITNLIVFLFVIRIKKLGTY